MQPVFVAKMVAKAVAAKRFMKTTESLQKLGKRQQSQNLMFHCRVIQEKELRYDTWKRAANRLPVLVGQKEKTCSVLKLLGRCCVETKGK